MFLLYQIVEALIFVLALPFYALGRIVGGRPFGSIFQRLGFYGGTPSRHDVWFHAVSVGEVNAAKIIIDHLRRLRPSLRLLITTTTVTGRGLAERLFPETEITWFPFDFTFSVRRFISHFDPAVYVAVETELWPILTRTAHDRGIELILANARISDRSFPRYHRLRFFIRRVLALFDHVLAREETDKVRLEALGAPLSSISVTGNVKFDYDPDTSPLPLADALDRFARSRAIIFASTAEGEEALLMPVIEHLVSRRVPVIIAPRRQSRFDEVARLLESADLRMTRRSEIGPADQIDGDLLLLDSIGELSRVYSHCAAAFIGGSLVPHGGQNPVEACAVGCPVAFGPHTQNFRDITEELVRHGAAEQVGDEIDLQRFFDRILDEERFRQERSRAAVTAIESNRGAAAAVAAVIDRALGGTP